jgi:hypothetical protein
MKKVYCDLQKAHMKKLKSETSGHKTEQEEGEEGTRKKKGFVANCLLKVACSCEGGADIKQLKVQFLQCLWNAMHVLCAIFIVYNYVHVTCRNFVRGLVTWLIWILRMKAKR